MPVWEYDCFKFEPTEKLRDLIVEEDLWKWKQLGSILCGILCTLYFAPVETVINEDGRSADIYATDPKKGTRGGLAFEHFHTFLCRFDWFLGDFQGWGAIEELIESLDGTIPITMIDKQIIIDSLDEEA